LRAFFGQTQPQITDKTVRRENNEGHFTFGFTYHCSVIYGSLCHLGTTWIAMKIALTSFTPVLATGLRFLLASPVLIGLARAGGHPLLFPVGKRRFQCCLALFIFHCLSR
jgi:drug/metabolite transporter (DMT)-like permease